MSVVSIYTVFASPEEAERIGLQVIEERLAACINILGPCRSIYRWEGAVESAQEVAGILKTTGEQADALVTRIAALHSYEAPCIAVWPITKSLSQYAAWVEENVRTS